jgi:hypothetical protein
MSGRTQQFSIIVEHGWHFIAYRGGTIPPIRVTHRNMGHQMRVGMLSGGKGAPIWISCPICELLIVVSGDGCNIIRAPTNPYAFRIGLVLLKADLGKCCTGRTWWERCVCRWRQCYTICKSLKVLERMMEDELRGARCSALKAGSSQRNGFCG